MEKKGIKIAAQNRKAYHDYFVEDRLEAGIELRGTEVKSIRAGTLNLKDSYCVVKNGEAARAFDTESIEMLEHMWSNRQLPRDVLTY